jgi:2'-hydroxyisoflavone reductase
VRLLVLGGTHHVGRAVVEEAIATGVTVTTLNRGTVGPPPAGVEHLRADRTDGDGMRSALAGREWEAVIDTWSGAPSAVRTATAALAGRVDHYGYVSSRSVYRWPIPVGADESAPVVGGDPEADDGSDYAAAKRGAEVAVLDAFGERSLVARVAAPGPPERPIQYIDGRDLAAWMLSSAQAGRSGVYDTVSRPGFATMGQILGAAATVTGGNAELVWITPEEVEAAGIAPWTEWPIWLPPEGEAAGLHAGNVARVHAAGLVCRPTAATVADTWAWLQAEGDPTTLSDGSVGLDPEREQRLLAGLRPA